MDVAGLYAVSCGTKERRGWEVPELAQSQVGDIDEVGCGPEAARGAFGLLHEAVHGFDECIAAVVEHAAHDGVEVRFQGCGQALEGGKAAAPHPRDPFLELDGGQAGLVVPTGTSEKLAQGHLQPSGARALEVGSLQPVHGGELHLAPAVGVCAASPTGSGRAPSGWESESFSPASSSDLISGYARI